MVVHRYEAGAITEEEVDVAGESGGELRREGFVGEIEVEIDAKLVELFGLEVPGIAFGGEERRARGIEGTESVHESGEVLGLGEMIEVVGVVAERSEERRVGKEC